MRRGEIFGLKWENVNIKTGCITLTETKNGKIRKIPISKTLKAELKNFNRFTEYVFTNKETGKPYSDIKKGYKSLCDGARIKNLRFHDLRHTAATRMVASGIDLVIVQDILGHADLKTTQRYAHPVPERKQKAIEALDEYCINFA
ncbi:MAG: site specific recombinase [Candidatus Peregrinibacteria bacterium GW2011_GWC2_33_13]|nr:MAG: site specific recombinase [Candidatus Peregrinibacteria bacterium GW2011_GWC2_33_13]